MGDRTYTQIEFSGAISEEQGEELLAHLEAQGCAVNDPAAGDKMDLAALSAGASFYDSECNYAQMEEIEAWCGENNVSYLKNWEAGGDYGPGLQLFDATTGETVECPALESAPAVPLSELITARNDGTIDTLIAGMQKFADFSTHFPPLKVLKVEDWTPEVCTFMAKRALEP